MNKFLLPLALLLGTATTSAITVTATQQPQSAQFRTNAQGFPVIPNLKANNVYTWRATITTRQSQRALFRMYSEQLESRDWVNSNNDTFPRRDQIRGQFRRNADRVSLTVTQLATNRFEIVVQQTR